MSVFRVEKNKNFTVMSNYHLKDTTLSLKAKGLLSLMLSLPENWDYTINGLATICKDGVDSIKATVKELEENGYIHRERIRNEKGHLTGTEYTIYEEPKTIIDNDTFVEENTNGIAEETEAESIPKVEKPSLVHNTTQPKVEKPLLDKPIVEKPILDKPTQEKPIVEKHIQLSTKESNTNLSNTNVLITNQSNPNQSIITEVKIDEIEDLKNKYNEYLEFIKLNIEYDFLCDNYKSQKESIDEIIDIMLEVVCSSKNMVSICGELLPTEVVKSRFLKINQFHIEYVLDCISKNTTKINNIKSYLKACIYNAPSTITNYYRAAVNYDMYGKNLY
ncbi:MAG: DUF6017 domain-containing protein [Lachnospirales bacterium]